MIARVLDATEPSGLTPEGWRRFDAAERRSDWGQRHSQRLALTEGSALVAGATQSDLVGTLDGRSVRICGIRALHPSLVEGDAGHASVLIERLVEQAEQDGADIALCFGADAREPAPDGFDVVPTMDLEIGVTESPRRGAPMMLVRGGEDRDLAAIAAMGKVRSSGFRFHLDRDRDFVKHAITRRRLLAGLEAAGARQLRFVIAEEGITAAAYAVLSIVGRTWTIEECGDRDPSGARVGAILQALIAREPAEQRPVIRGWLPAGFVPPQITIRSSAPALEVVHIRFLASTACHAPLLSGDVLYWRSDVF